MVKGLDRAQRQLGNVEARITKLEERIHERDGELKREELYQDHERWHALHLERQRWDHELESLMEEWSRQSELVTDLRRELASFDQTDLRDSRLFSP